VKRLLLLVPLVLLAGCESLPFLSAKDQLESLVTVYAAGTYTVNVSKDGKALYTETWTCTAADGKMTGCHRQTATQWPAPSVP
jgi:hypothetical protein